MGWGIQDWRDHWKKKFGKGGKVEMNPTQVMCVGFDAGENVEGVRIDRMVKGGEWAIETASDGEISKVEFLKFKFANQLNEKRVRLGIAWGINKIIGRRNGLSGNGNVFRIAFDESLNEEAMSDIKRMLSDQNGGIDGMWSVELKSQFITIQRKSANYYITARKTWEQKFRSKREVSMGLRDLREVGDPETSSIGDIRPP